MSDIAKLTETVAWLVETTALTAVLQWSDDWEMQERAKERLVQIAGLSETGR